MEMDKDCPICNGQYSQIGKAEFVCEKHEGWFITTCDECGRTVFAAQVHLCGKCAAKRTHGR